VGEAAKILTITDEAYYADPCPEPSLSSSIAKVLVGRSAAHAYLQHPRLGGKPRVPTKAMEAGSLVDEILLNGEARVFRVSGFDNWKKDAAQNARDRARAQGLVPCLDHEYEKALDAVVRIREQLPAFGIVLRGDDQVTLQWQEETSWGRKIYCRARLDHLIRTSGVIYDLKVTADAHPDAITRTMINMGYPLQGYAYQRAVAANFHDLAGRTRFELFFCEYVEPFCVVPARLGGSMEDLGRMQWERAVNMWGQCLETGKWPGYVTEAIRPDAPNWAIGKELEHVSNF
jgi:hypothetical protein